MDTQPYYSPHASLVLIGKYFRTLGLWSVVEAHVHIRQKTVHHTPVEKLLDAFISMLAGGHGLVETNTRVRPDPAVQHAFGRPACAEQSTISRTLSACSDANVVQLRQSLQHILQQHSRACRHRYGRAYQVLDVDMTGLVAGAQAVGATKGYFARARHRRGRQLGRVLATAYDEVLVERLYPGKRQLEQSFQPLVEAAEAVLALTEKRRKRTLLRTDGGAGDDANINWALGRGYRVLTKVHNWQRAYRLAQTVQRWYRDPKGREREVGWVSKPVGYAAPTRQLAVRYPKKQKKGQGDYHYHVLVVAAPDALLFTLSQQPHPKRVRPRQRLFAALYAYDLREGGLETQNRSDKRGLGLSKRNKRSFQGQEMLVLLAQLAHNFVIWSRNRLAHTSSPYHAFGIQRMVRDVLHIDGQVARSPKGRQLTVTLNNRHPHAAAVHKAFGR